MKFILPLIAALFSFSISVSATPVISMDQSNKELKKQFTKNFNNYRSAACSTQIERDYKKLYSAYKKNGFYVPMIKGSVDREAIQSQLSLLGEKRNWLNKQIKNFPNRKVFPRFSRISKNVNYNLKSVLDLNKKIRLTRGAARKKALIKQLTYSLKKLDKSFDAFAKKVSFLTNFKYPVNHQKNRIDYEQIKSSYKSNDILAKNKVYLKRRILEDGAMDKDGRRSDIYLRTTFDSLSYRLDKHILTDDVRYDLEWVLLMTKKELSRGPRKLKERLVVWRKKIQRQINFYYEIVDNKEKAKLFSQNHSKASLELRRFIDERHLMTYKFYSKLPEIQRALFVFNQILINEAGAATPYNYRDRIDIAQIIINRFKKPHFNQLRDGSRLKNLVQKSIPNYKSLKWLNVMYKRLEFSFTLYFIPASYYTFCPDMFKVARHTRKKNLELSISALRNPRDEFNAVKYFSRFSMVGKIDMSPIWGLKHQLAERAGRRIYNSSKFQNAIRRNKYDYLYSFKSRDETNFDVIRIGKNIYSLKHYPKSPMFHNYRDPHKFTYFADSKH